VNLVDIPILAVLAAVIALIVRGMLQGTIRTCDSASCSGNCGSCGSKCATPRFKLSREQIAQLDALTEQAKEVRP
jgi:hypothetical protein